MFVCCCVVYLLCFTVSFIVCLFGWLDAYLFCKSDEQQQPEDDDEDDDSCLWDRGSSFLQVGEGGPYRQVHGPAFHVRGRPHHEYASQEKCCLVLPVHCYFLLSSSLFVVVVLDIVVTVVVYGSLFIACYCALMVVCLFLLI